MPSHPGEPRHNLGARELLAWFPVSGDPNLNADWIRDLVENSQDLLCVHDLQGKLLSINPAPARLLGYTVEEMLTIPMQDLIPPEFRPQFDEYLERIAREGEVRGLLAVMTRSGEQRIWEYRNTLRTEGVVSPVVRGIAHDVTERVLAERALRESNKKLMETARQQEALLRELKLFRTLLDQSNEALEVVDPETMRLLDVNEKACEELGYSREELLSMTVFDIDPLVTPDLVARSSEELRSVGCLTLESLHRRKDGTTFPVEVNMKRAQLDREYVVALSRDITQRKLREARLQEYEKVLESLNEMIAVVNRDHRYVLANRALLQYRGMTKDQVVGRHVTDFLSAAAYETTVKAKLDQCFEGQIVTYEMKYTYPEVGERDLFITYLPVEGPTGIDRVACVVRDITERKRAEQALRASEAELREAQRVAHMGSWRLDLASGEMTFSEELYRMIRLDSSRPAPKFPELESFLTPHAWNQVKKACQEQIEAGPKQGIEVEFRRTDGTTGWALLRGDGERDATGKVIALHGGALDITERKQSEEALQQREAELKEAQRVARMGGWRVDVANEEVTWSEELYRMIGQGGAHNAFSFHELQGFLTEDSWEVLKKAYHQVLDTSQPGHGVEVEFRRLDGTTGWVILRGAVDYDDAGKVIGMHGGALDISDRKRAEQALRESEEHLRLAQEVAGIGVFERNFLTGESRWTPQMETIYGLPPGGYPRTAEKFVELVHPDDRQRVAALLAESFESGEVSGEWRVVWPSGTVRWISGRWRVFKDATGKPVRSIGMDFDITERKRVEEALREAKEHLSEEKLYLEHTIDTELGFEEIVGTSEGLRAVMEQVAKVAASDATVLLLGETGVGKELVARAIHRLSTRNGNSFIKMNCAAIPSGLLESELFGAEKGAFTGAVSRKIGRLELADNGTLFLDEIGEIALPLQPKLLRVLQDREFERLGGTKTLKVNFRLIAATNRDLAESVRLKEFRHDLYYRLNVFPIRVPPLRDRRDDIPPLVEHFVQKYARRMNKGITSIPKKTMDALVRWSWPGNVRELENFVERSVILTHGSVLAAPLTELQAPAAVEIRKDETLAAIERELILRALHESRGRISGPGGAASRLGLKRTTLQSKLKQMGIDPRKSHA